MQAPLSEVTKLNQVNELIDFYKTTYLAKYGADPLGLTETDRGTLKAVLQKTEWDSEKARNLIATYFSMDGYKGWFTNSAHSIKCLIQNIEAVFGQSLKSQARTKTNPEGVRPPDSAETIAKQKAYSRFCSSYISATAGPKPAFLLLVEIIDWGSRQTRKVCPYCLSDIPGEYPVHTIDARGNEILFKCLCDTTNNFNDLKKINMRNTKYNLANPTEPPSYERCQKYEIDLAILLDDLKQYSPYHVEMFKKGMDVVIAHENNSEWAKDNADRKAENNE